MSISMKIANRYGRTDPIHRKASNFKKDDNIN